jgi:hypothetical protein
MEELRVSLQTPKCVWTITLRRKYVHCALRQPKCFLRLHIRISIPAIVVLDGMSYTVSAITLCHEISTESSIVAFAGAIILLAANLSYVVPIDVRNESFNTSWSCCIKVLEYYRLQISPAAKAITILENLKEKVQAMNRSTPVTEVPPSANGPSVSIPAQVKMNPENIDSGITGETGLDMEGLDMFTMDPLTDAWFTQQLSDMSWLDFT